jgi:para-aminobenzoate synthetase
MRCVIVDNYDSFTFNLYQLVWEAGGVEPIVVRNDQLSWEDIDRLGCDNVILSPGPGRPDRAGDFGVCAAVLAHSRVPVLGVCLGHQGLGVLCGAEVIRAPEPMHGRTSRVIHSGRDLFAGMPQRFEVVRYHSLILAEPLPDELECVARTPDGTVLGVRHRVRPLWGVQFHPESIGTELGLRLIENFNMLTPRRASAAFGEAGQRHSVVSAGKSVRRASVGSGTAPEHEVRVRRLPCAAEPEDVFVALYAKDDPAFWLDGGLVEDGRSRFSFMGNAKGPLATWGSYFTATGELTLRRRGETVVERGPLLPYLQRQLDRFRIAPVDLPFAFSCGFAGYLGYELKGECGAAPGRPSALPDAQLIFADRVIAFDRAQREVYLLALAPLGLTDAGVEADRWLEDIATRLKEGIPPAAPPRSSGAVPRFSLAREADQYLEDIGVCLDAIREGESYEVCLTNQVIAEVKVDPLALYRVLRRLNPAPYSSFLRLGDHAVASSSPERFLAIDAAGRMEARPIKGTCRRGKTPPEDDRLAETLRTEVKNRAENLMIVDLLRSDLGQVSAPGSVRVPRLMEVERYATVHQLVSTISAQLRPGATAIDAVRACFPGGSMTGAPKLRTMEIIDRLEAAPRGVYSGALGYLSLDGAIDLSIVIRTAVVEPGRVTIGAGGAIVALSDPHAELDEVLLKAAPVMHAVLEATSGEGAGLAAALVQLRGPA